MKAKYEIGRDPKRTFELKTSLTASHMGGNGSRKCWEDLRKRICGLRCLHGSAIKAPRSTNLPPQTFNGSDEPHEDEKNGGKRHQKGADSITYMKSAECEVSVGKETWTKMPSMLSNQGTKVHKSATTDLRCLCLYRERRGKWYRAVRKQ